MPKTSLIQNNNKFKISYLVLCDFASLSNQNKLNIIGAFENISATEVPSMHPQFFIAGSIKVIQKGKYDFSIIIIDNDGIEIAQKQNFPYDSAEAAKSNSQDDNILLLVQIVNLKLEKFGDYKVVLSADEEVLAEAEFHVVKAK